VEFEGSDDVAAVVAVVVVVVAVACCCNSNNCNAACELSSLRQSLSPSIWSQSPTETSCWRSVKKSDGLAFVSLLLLLLELTVAVAVGVAIKFNCQTVAVAVAISVNAAQKSCCSRSSFEDDFRLLIVVSVTVVAYNDSNTF